ncbi:hypothetical protein PQ455_10625 [Sphingomonas naphthae]|uniref:Transmembrane protein n=1 Tax=Sphingomonas naphthae TaxID=1813468 RepID=A0ABY7TH10_9SPHN|nr:hypothetical protein [Sphingomonas naphthae]WCT72101.1 hypothetical protein PQ455_10625 [Sphingomonas naphthae]
MQDQVGRGALFSGLHKCPCKLTLVAMWNNRGFDIARYVILATLAFSSIIALSTGAILAAVWTIDARSLPAYAVVPLCFCLLIGFLTGLPAFCFRRDIGRQRLNIIAAGSVGFLSAVCILMGMTYSNSCSAVGWNYDQDADLMIPAIVWTDTWSCHRVGNYQQFSGVWNYGERHQSFQPTGAQASLPPGNLYIDEAAANMIFDHLLHHRPNRYAGASIFIKFGGNVLAQGRHDATDRPLYQVRDISEAHLLNE